MAAEIWALFGRHAGDNRQMAALAAATGLSWKVVSLDFAPLKAIPPFLLPPTLLTLSADARARLKAAGAEGWPRFVIASGGKSVAAARWIKGRSGGTTRLVGVGRPWTRLSLFDLIVTTPQYGLPERPNVARNLFALAASGRAAASVRDDILDLPRPRVVALAGGDSRPLTFDPATAGRLARAALARAERDGGSVIVVTSPRTSKAAADALEGALGVSATRSRLIRFGEDRALFPEALAAADRFVVTGDSASMISEAVATGAPVDVFPLPRKRDLRLRLKDFWLDVLGLSRFGRFVRARLEDAGIMVATRDLAAYAAALRDAGLLDGGEAAPRRAEAELAQAAARMLRLGAPAVVTARLPRGRSRIARPA